MAECGCGEGKACAACGGEREAYWCETCRQAVDHKRCPQCGLKAKKIRGE